MAEKSALVLLAQGCEEMEAVTIIDVLRRANVEVVVAGLEAGPVTASRRTRILPDCTIEEAMSREYDMVARPGGMPGAQNLGNDPRVIAFLEKMAGDGKFTCAICAAPTVLAKAGLLENKRATSYPGFLDQMAVAGMTVTKEAVVRDGHVITGRGPAAAMEFALELVEALAGKEVRRQVEKGLLGLSD